MFRMVSGVCAQNMPNVRQAMGCVSSSTRWRIGKVGLWTLGSVGGVLWASQNVSCTTQSTADKQESSRAVAEQKMQRNAIKARKEHYAKEGDDVVIAYAKWVWQKEKSPGTFAKLTSWIYTKQPEPRPCQGIITEEELALFKQETPLPKKSLRITHDVDAKQGKRKEMEDTHLFLQGRQGTLAGIFDGHSGKRAAEYVQERVNVIFFSTLQKNKGDVRKTFMDVFDQIEQEIVQGAADKNSGTAAVLSFIHPKTNKIYTATIGDSEANIYRMVTVKSNGHFQSAMRSIPLSCLRNWTSPKDRARLQLAQPERNLDDEFQGPNHKYYARYPEDGINLSRALGDEEVKALAPTVFLTPNPLIHKPKITVEQLYPGDQVVIACDGLRDFVREDEIIRQLAVPSKSLAKQLVSYAIRDKRSTDNVSVMVLKVEEKE